ncbi:MAG: helix-turn-helix domain-containing protein [Lachnospiraceae bacterium]|nr:helix-turn-helix domain-containing protein [Lachnospiraceae bacterium]
MNIGKRIKTYREKADLTQKQLADELNISVQAVSQWENEKTSPDVDFLTSIAKILKVRVGDLLEDIPESPDWSINDQIFSEEHMFTRLKGYTLAEGLTETNRALYYAREKHDGQFRDTSDPKKRIPYIIHPLMMACHAHAMGIRDDAVLATILLHDVCEDCGVKPEDLPFSEPVKRAVALLTKPPESRRDADYKRKYYDAIATDNIASIVKVIDRCNNVSLMSLSFKKDRLIGYIEETEEYVYPLLEHIKREEPVYYDAQFLIKYQLRSMLESVKAFIIG